MDLDTLLKEAKALARTKKKQAGKKRIDINKLFDGAPATDERPVIPWKAVAVVAHFYRSTCSCGNIMEYPEPGNCYVRSIDIRKSSTKQDIATPCALLPAHLPRMVEWHDIHVRQCPVCFQTSLRQLSLKLDTPHDALRFQRVAFESMLQHPPPHGKKHTTAREEVVIDPLDALVDEAIQNEEVTLQEMLPCSTM